MGFRQWLADRLAPPAAPPHKARDTFSTDDAREAVARRRMTRTALPALVLPSAMPGASVGTMDDGADLGGSLKLNMAGQWEVVPDVQMAWYAKQTFIGYQLCGLMAQHWLIGKACKMPAQDAVRNGWNVGTNDGNELEPDETDFIRKLDKRMKLKSACVEYINFGRVFGIRVAKFVVDHSDPNYYELPFNIDSVGPGMYKGISQIDPYWIVPLLTNDGVNRPGSMHFYEPEFWQINGEKIHRSHLCIFVPDPVVDVYKPAYYYGGVSIPQKIFERVYAAERTANEAPQMAMTKRLIVMKTDLSKALADQPAFDSRMSWWTDVMNNYGVKLVDTEDTLEQHDTALADFDNLIMTQYQLVAASSEVPGTKLLGTQPKGFNSTGEFEEASYHETLEGIQDNDLTPLLDRHYKLLSVSYLQPKFGKDFDLSVEWNELDAMTALEQAQLNLARAQTDAALETIGAIDAQDIRNRIITDPDSGYSGLSDEVPEIPPEEIAGAATIKGTVPKAKPVPGA